MLSMVMAGFMSTICAAGPSDAERARWMAEMQQYKREYVVKAMQLNDAQKAKFLPLYDAMDRDMRKIGDEARTVEKNLKAKGAAATDADYRHAADVLFNLRTREGAVEKQYYEKFKTVLSPRQLYELKRAEEKFAREMMRQHRDRRGKKR